MHKFILLPNSRDHSQDNIRCIKCAKLKRKHVEVTLGTLASFGYRCAKCKLPLYFEKGYVAVGVDNSFAVKVRYRSVYRIVLPFL